MSLRLDPFAFPDPMLDNTSGTGTATAVLGGGCFWCTEAVYLQLGGVLKVRPGYAGGEPGTANYRAVCSGTTGHAEVIEITYERLQISFGQLLKMFFSIAHDPTQLNRQGHDVGTQYRSAVFYQTEEEKKVTAAYIKQLEEAGAYHGRIVTTLEPLATFYVAEDYHHNYAALNPDQGYIRAVALPKAEKARKANAAHWPINHRR